LGGRQFNGAGEEGLSSDRPFGQKRGRRLTSFVQYRKKMRSSPFYCLRNPAQVSSAKSIKYFRANALVSPTEQEYELILSKIRNLVEEGRGETIFEVNIS
jgi:predicted ATPase